MTRTATPPNRTSGPGARPRRGGSPPLLALGLAVAVLAAYLAVWAHLSHVDEVGSDYSTFHVAALLWRDGQGSHLYDQAAETARHNQLVPPGYHVDLPYISPPTTALLTAPLTVLDLATAFRVASLLQVTLVGAAVVVALRAAPRRAGAGGLERAGMGAASLAGVGTLVLLLMGQWDGLCALGLALAYAAWRTDRDLLGGLALALTMAPTKPHLAIGLAAFLLGTRRARALGGAAVGVAVTVVAGLAVAGPRGWADWLAALSLSSGHSPLASLLGTTGLAGSWLGDTRTAHLLGLAGSAAAAVACLVLGDAVRRGRSALEPALAGAAALSLLAAPHLLMHDLSVLAPAAAWLLAWASTQGITVERRVWLSWPAFNLVCLADLGNSSMAPPGRLVPLALAAAGAAAIGATRRSRLARARRGGGTALPA